MVVGELPNFTIVPFRKSNTALEYNWIISGEEDEDEEEHDGPPATSPSISTDDACCVRVVKSVNAMVKSNDDRIPAEKNKVEDTKKEMKLLMAHEREHRRRKQRQLPHYYPGAAVRAGHRSEGRLRAFVCVALNSPIDL
jgi:hypothetical protein